jgi:hypothetical protein
MATCGDANGTDEGSRADVESEVADHFGDVEVAKVDHHGSSYSSSAAHVGGLAAQVAVVSVGDNSYGHPVPSALNRWRNAGSILYQTQSGVNGREIDGTVTIRTDGESGFDALTNDGTHHFWMDEEPAAPNGSTTLRMLRTPSTLTYGHRAIVRGLLRSGGDVLGGRSVRLEARTVTSDTWSLVDSGSTRATGSINFTFEPARTRVYRLHFLGGTTFDPSISDTRWIYVHPRVRFHLSDRSIDTGDPVRWNGRVLPNHGGDRVVLQRRVDGSWTRVDADRIGSGGAYSARWTPGSKGTKRLRVYFPKQDRDHLAGHSVARALEVGGSGGGGGGGGGGNCDPNYEGACLRPDVSDYDCAGGGGNGPYYVEGPVYVVGDDHYGLDADGDGVACES